MNKIFLLALLGVALSGCTIPGTDIVLWEDAPVVECTLEPCEQSQTIESSLELMELLPLSIVGTNQAELPILDQCETDVNVFVDCYPLVAYELVVFQENYAAVVPSDLNVSSGVDHELECSPSKVGLVKADFSSSFTS